MPGTTIEADDGSCRLRVSRVPSAVASVLFMPGGNCRAERYDWLDGLNRSAISVFILDARPISTLQAAAGGGVASNAQFLWAIKAVEHDAPKIFAGGHSAGAALVLDSLDPPSNTRAVYPLDYQPPQNLSGVAVFGCSLQSHALTIAMPYRSETRLLHRPNQSPLLFLSGDHDAIAPPSMMEKTRKRYAPPTALVTLKGGTHYGFTDGADSSDNPTFNVPGAPDTAPQRARVLGYLSSWITTGQIAPIGGDTLVVSSLGRRGGSIRPTE